MFSFHANRVGVDDFASNRRRAQQLFQTTVSINCIGFRPSVKLVFRRFLERQRRSDRVKLELGLRFGVTSSARVCTA
jgi:hypothetical protein